MLWQRERQRQRQRERLWRLQRGLRCPDTEPDADPDLKPDTKPDNAKPDPAQRNVEPHATAHANASADTSTDLPARRLCHGTVVTLGPVHQDMRKGLSYANADNDRGQKRRRSVLAPAGLRHWYT